MTMISAECLVHAPACLLEAFIGPSRGYDTGKNWTKQTPLDYRLKGKVKYKVYKPATPFRY